MEDTENVSSRRRRGPTLVDMMGFGSFYYRRMVSLVGSLSDCSSALFSRHRPNWREAIGAMAFTSATKVFERYFGETIFRLTLSGLGLDEDEALAVLHKRPN